MSASVRRLDAEGDSAYAYHLLRVSLEAYARPPSRLDADELARARRAADAAFEIESLVLSSHEARGVDVSAIRVEQACDEVAARYASRAELVADLERHRLDLASLRASLRRELLFDAIMRRVASDSEVVREHEVTAFYEARRTAFERAETRTARHLLITVNPDYPENAPGVARRRMEHIVALLAGDAARFAALAVRYSECPTAMQGGLLGSVRRGQLFPEIDAALFRLPAAAVSEIVESPMGLHLVSCEKIEPARRVPLHEARDSIRRLLRERRLRARQQRWLAALRRGVQAGEGMS